MAFNLNRRERYALILAAVFAGLFIVVQFMVFPFLDKREQLQRSAAAKGRVLSEMQLLRTEYDKVRRQSELAGMQFSRRPKGFTLFSFLDQLAGKAGLKGNITYMKPSTSSQKNSPYKQSLVEMKMQAITLKQLTTYLHMVETSRNMARIKRLSIQKQETQKGAINVVLQVETLEM